MSLIIKIILPIAIAVAAIWGYLTYVQPEPAPAAYVPPVHEQQPAPQAPAVQTAATQITASGSSDASLDADLSTIDAQLQGAAQSSADASAADTAGDTSY